MFSPRFPINRVLQGGLSFVFCNEKGKIKGLNKFEVSTKFHNVEQPRIAIHISKKFFIGKIFFLFFFCEGSF